MATANKTKAKSTAKKTTKKKNTTEEYKEYNLVDEKIIDSSTKSENDDFEEESMKRKKISHRDIINYIFNDINTFNNLSDYTLKQHFFMLNRTFSIKYPQQAAAFNNVAVNMPEAVKSWVRFLHKKDGYGQTPSFVFSKGAKKTQEEKQQKATADDEYVITTQIMDEYCKHYSLSLRDFKDMLEFFKEQTIADVQRFEKTQTGKEFSFRKEKN